MRAATAAGRRFDLRRLGLPHLVVAALAPLLLLSFLGAFLMARSAPATATAIIDCITRPTSGKPSSGGRPYSPTPTGRSMP